ncbi:MAG: cupin domain-containing protein [Azospirillaceae bacterium]
MPDSTPPRTAPDPVRLADKFALITEQWSPKIVARVDDHDVRLAKIEGAFSWHKHDDADELFMIVDGAMRMELRDRTVALAAGDVFVVPRGVEHRPVADAECRIIMIERAGTMNTGDATDREGTAGEWL